MSTHPDRRPIIRPSRRVFVAEHRGRLLELAELRTLAEMMRENGQSFDDFAEALRDRERAMIRETHVRTSQRPQDGRSRDVAPMIPILE